MATLMTGPGTVPAPAGPVRKDPKKPKPSAVKEAPAPVWASPVKPSLVLLPAKARGLKARRRAARQATFLSLGMLGAAAGGYLFVLAGTAGAQAELDKETAITAATSAYLAEHRDVQSYADGLIERKAAASAALDGDVAYSKVTRALQDANTVGAVYTSIKTLEPGVECTPASPFALPTSLGCVEVTGEAPTVEAVAKLVASLNKEGKILAEPYLTESTVADGRASFKLSIGHTTAALSLKGDGYEPSAEEYASIEKPAATVPGADLQGAAQ